MIRRIIEEIGEHFGVNSLVLEDLMSPTHLPKIEIYEDYVFIILKHLDSDTASLNISREQIGLIYWREFCDVAPRKPRITLRAYSQ